MISSRQVVPLLIIPYLAWRVYMRVRRNIGRQLFHPGRLKVSIGIFATLAVAFLVYTLPNPLVAAALGGGLVLAVPIALYGIKLTKFEDTPQGKFYTPNTALGIGISALFLGRVGYRILVLYLSPDLRTVAAQPPMQSPLTFFLFGLSAGYFIAYQTGVLIRSHKPAPSVGN
jgi:hypothetical protein